MSKSIIRSIIIIIRLPYLVALVGKGTCKGCLRNDGFAGIIVIRSSPAALRGRRHELYRNAAQIAEFSDHREREREKRPYGARLWGRRRFLQLSGVRIRLTLAMLQCVRRLVSQFCSYFVATLAYFHLRIAFEFQETSIYRCSFTYRTVDDRWWRALSLNEWTLAVQPSAFDLCDRLALQQFATLLRRW